MNVTGWTDRFSTPLVEINKDFKVDEAEALEEWLKELKSKNPEISTTLFKAAPDVVYNDAMTWLSKIRKSPEVPNVVLAAEVQ